METVLASHTKAKRTEIVVYLEPEKYICFCHKYKMKLLMRKVMRISVAGIGRPVSDELIV